MKEKTKARKQNTDPELGDAYTFLAVERDSKLSRPSPGTADLRGRPHVRGEARRRNGRRFQISTDGFYVPYSAAL